MIENQFMLPWKVQKREDYPTGVRIYGFDGRACSIGDINFEDFANFIVERINGWDELKEAATGLLRIMFGEFQVYLARGDKYKAPEQVYPAVVFGALIKLQDALKEGK